MASLLRRTLLAEVGIPLSRVSELNLCRKFAEIDGTRELTEGWQRDRMLAPGASIKTRGRYDVELPLLQFQRIDSVFGVFGMLAFVSEKSKHVDVCVAFLF